MSFSSRDDEPNIAEAVPREFSFPAFCCWDGKCLPDPVVRLMSKRHKCFHCLSRCVIFWLCVPDIFVAIMVRRMVVDHMFAVSVMLFL